MGDGSPMLTLFFFYRLAHFSEHVRLVCVIGVRKKEYHVLHDHVGQAVDYVHY